MKIEELKSKVDAYRLTLKEKDGKIVSFSDTGPAGMGLIDALVKTIEELTERVSKLEKQS